MLNVTFIKSKRAPDCFDPVEYTTSQTNHVIAAMLVTLTFKQEHDHRYYDKMPIISNARIL